MRRIFEEISDDEWAKHSFKPSRVLKKGRSSPPPLIESFAYRSGNGGIANSNGLSSVDVVNLEDEEDGVEVEEKFLPVTRTTRGSLVRRYVVDEDSDDEGGNDRIDLSGEDEEDAFYFGISEKIEEEVKWEENEFDVVGNAIQKCAKISADLRRELYGSSVSACDRYAEVDASSARIVTQEDISEACSNECSELDLILKPYQLVGVNFLVLLYRKNIGGAILADEMGLGKTVQAVTYLSLLKHLNDDPGPHLIVCPASVLENWERELKRWCPTFSVILFHGAGRAVYAKELTSMGKAGFPPSFNVLLACYSLFERHSSQQKDDRKALKLWRWSCVILDEAHFMKDKNSYRWKNLMSVAKGARQRLMLTGTPLQNDLHELWSLLEFMMPDIFTTGDIDLKKLLNLENNDLIPRIKSILGPFILRRLKSDVMQQLVPKIQHIANHPLLVRRVYNDEDVDHIAKALYPKGVFGFECTLERVIQEIRGYNDFSIHQLLLMYGDLGTNEVLTNEHVLGSAKCQALADLLPCLHNKGNRVLIFSQWTAMLDILEWALEVIGVTYRRLDGSTPVAERQTIVDSFNNDLSIFACLLSTRAGGQGLNLIGADTVIIHDMDFNPQMDRQAEDRCHRIGQVKPVTVYRLVTKGTVDENIYEIARRKLVLDAAVLQSGTALENDDDVPQKTMGEILSSLLLV
ncbi:hypothetical protein HPP92_025347 [Vanilla planifolia]|uniref:Uncharacterized protein n=1 Tax=Vanilla planifolia TaxID=51239 RepID=A0A835UAD4_VANPL|nr:hypothetical protein HPP92_025347 [Vanilla planifolia]